MRYIIMCGGKYPEWETPKQLLKVDGEPIVARTIRLLRENGIKRISISSDNDEFLQFGLPVLSHDNSYISRAYNDCDGHWCDAFYPTDEPTCYIFGDVIFSPEAIRTIVETDTDDIELFGSMPPFAENYPKPYVEPFALKVADTDHLKRAVAETKKLDAEGRFYRRPIMWELWQVIKGTKLNKTRKNYTAINDYTCDVDYIEEIPLIEKIMKEARGQ